ncbi:MAG: hypothetical protein JWM11_6078 [Planctomycetaceae bacterium]|nr:hypothetical protein [Planctomycetaceae bacterium]
MTDHSVTPANTDETEEQIIRTAQQAISHCRWVVGDCASKWTQRHSRGRTDLDFGNLVGLSGDQIYQRRRVWETFSDVRSQFPNLKWSHFYSALNWDDAADCLQWAEETQATVAEMKAWRRALRGEDLTAEPEATEILPSGLVNYVSGERSFVQDPADFGSAAGMRRPAMPTGMGNESDAARVATLARELDPLGDNYAPFHSGAITPPPGEMVEKSEVTEALSPEQLAKRLCSTLERCSKALTEDFVEQLETLPPKLKKRLTVAIEDLYGRLTGVKA